MSQYSAGTINTTGVDSTISGIGTQWLTGPTPIKAGNVILIAGDPCPYYVTAIISDTQLTINAIYPYILSDASYTISMDFSPNLSLPLLSSGDLRAADILRRTVLQLDGFFGNGLRYKMNVLSLAVMAQPGSPSNGDTYVIPSGATGAAWAGNTNNYAVYVTATTSWTITAPVLGDMVYDQANSQFYFYGQAVGGAFGWFLFGGTINFVGGHAKNCNFVGQIAVTGSGNSLIMQKTVELPEGGTITAAQITGVDDILGTASGATIVTISSVPYGTAGGYQMTIALANNTSAASATGSVPIAAGSNAYIYITQATGGHAGLQMQFQYH